MNAFNALLNTLIEDKVELQTSPDYVVTVNSYCERTDSFKVRIAANFGGAGGGDEEIQTIDGNLLPLVIREFGEPSELVGRVFEVKIT